MPQLLNTVAFNEFYNAPVVPIVPFGKTIQKTYRFLVTFMPNIAMQSLDMIAEVGPMPIIRGMLVKNVSIPQYAFKKETQMYGPIPRSFPVLEHDGFEVKIEFEEDDKGTIGNFINWMQRLAIEPKYGLYTPPDFVKIPVIAILTETDDGFPIGAYTLHDAFYLNATGPDLDYSDNSAVRYSVTFNVDVINSFYPQSYAFNAVAGIAGKAIAGAAKSLGI